MRLDQDLIKKIEGLTQEISDKKNARQAVDPITWVMQQCGVSLLTVRCWAKGRDSSNMIPHGASKQLYADFAEVWSQFQAVCAEAPIQVIKGIWEDTDVAPAERFKTAKWYVEHIWPERCGPNASKVEVEISAAEPQSQVADIPQAVFDEMHDDEVVELERIQKQIEDAKAAAAALIKTVRGRVLTPADMW